jgi:hypothetical protein
MSVAAATTGLQDLGPGAARSVSPAYPSAVDLQLRAMGIKIFHLRARNGLHDVMDVRGSVRPQTHIHVLRIDQGGDGPRGSV